MYKVSAIRFLAEVLGLISSIFLDAETEPFYIPVLKEYVDNKCFEG